MIDSHFVILGASFSFIGGLNYLIGTLKGKVKANKVSWFLWALAPLITFAAEVGQGVGLQSLMTFVVGMNALLIFSASFINKKSEWKITKFDLVCGILSLIGLSLWALTKVGNLAILFSILADGLAGVPTLVKAYKAPETESYIVFLFGAISATITLLTVRIWNFANYGFPLYILSINIPLILLIKFRLGKIINNYLALNLSQR